MASLGQSFNEDDLPQSSGDFAPLPEGWYNAVINSALIKNTKDNSGQYIAVRYDITGPTHQGRVVFGNINIKNKSSQAEEIARQALGSIMRAIGLPRVDDTDQLVGGNLQIKLSIRAQDGYGPTNEVRGYKPIGGESKTPMPSSFGDSSNKDSTQKNEAASPPWKKK
jgi:hypothetical protein